MLKCFPDNGYHGNRKKNTFQVATLMAVHIKIASSKTRIL